MSDSSPERSQAGLHRESRYRTEAALLAPAVALAATVFLPARPAAVIATGIVLLGSLRAVFTRRRTERLRIDDIAAVEHQLARWRRRNETAAVLVVEPSAGHPARQLAPSLRTTDAVALVSSVRGPRLIAALDGYDLDRRGLERRLIALGADPSRLGWASFPGDGTTLVALVDTATAAAMERETRSSRRPGAAGRRSGTATCAAGDLAGTRTHMESAR